MIVMSPVVFIVYLTSFVASAPYESQQLKEDAGIVEYLKQLR